MAPYGKTASVAPSTSVVGKLPVLVLFQSAASSSSFASDNDDATGNAEQIDNESAVQSPRQRQQQQAQFSKINQTSSSQLSAFGTNQMHTNQVNYGHLQLAHRTQAIVITFNHRIGLLGFLPFVDSSMLELEHDEHDKFASFGRQNHAIWDQIGLLHWVKHNIASFNGDPANISLVATDHKSSQSIQLLAMSPQAKGLFKRMVLIEEHASGKVDLIDLINLSLKSRQFRPQLINQLALIVRQQQQQMMIVTRNSSAFDYKLANELNQTSDWLKLSADEIRLPRQVFEYIQAADLYQLAQLQLELNAASNGQTLVQLITEPNLDDRLLFPQFAVIFHQMVSFSDGRDETGSDKQLSRAQIDANWLLSQLYGRTTLNSIRQRLEYCDYIRQISINHHSTTTTTATNLVDRLRSIAQRLLATSDNAKTNNSPLDAINELNNDILAKLDPLHLIPRATMSMFAVDGLQESPNTGSGDSPAIGQWRKTQQRQQHPFTPQFEPNRISNVAATFSHLAQVRLLYDMLLKTIRHHRTVNDGNIEHQSSLWAMAFGDNSGENDDEEIDQVSVNSRQSQKMLLASSINQQQQQRRKKRHANNNNMINWRDNSAKSNLSNPFDDPNNSVDLHLEAPMHQLAALVGSYDLMLGFVGVGRRQIGQVGKESRGLEQTTLSKGPETANKSSYSKIVSALEQSIKEPEELQMQQLPDKDELLAGFYWADLHYFGRLLNNNDNMIASNFSSCSAQSNRMPDNDKTRSASTIASSFLFVWPTIGQQTVRSDNYDHNGSLLHRDADKWSEFLGPYDTANHRSAGSERLIDHLADFVRFGNPSGQSNETWSSYRTFDALFANTSATNNQDDDEPSAHKRHVNLVRSSGTGSDTDNDPIGISHLNHDLVAALRNWASFKLDLEPWLVQMSRVKHSMGQTTTTTNGQQARQAPSDDSRSGGHRATTSLDVTSISHCLDEIDASLWPEVHGNNNNKLVNNNNKDNESMKLSCLANLTLRLRNQVRSSGSAELRPIWDKLVELLDRSSSSSLASHYKQRQQQQQQRTSSLSARNLINPDDWLQQANEHEPWPEASSNIARLSTTTTMSNASTTPTGSDRQQMFFVRDATTGQMVLTTATDHTGVKRPNQTVAMANSYRASGSSSVTGSATVGRLWSMAQNFAVGQALSVVVGTGLAIFLINLLIVLLVVRSARRRPAGAQQVGDDGDDDQSRFGRETGDFSVTCLTGNDETSAKTHSIHLTQSSRPQHGFEGANGTLSGSPPLVSSFRTQNHAATGPNTSNQADSGTRSVKSIKFDLSGLNRSNSDEFVELDAVQSFAQTIPLVELMQHPVRNDTTSNQLPNHLLLNPEMLDNLRATVSSDQNIAELQQSEQMLINDNELTSQIQQANGNINWPVHNHDLNAMHHHVTSINSNSNTTSQNSTDLTNQMMMMMMTCHRHAQTNAGCAGSLNSPFASTSSSTATSNLQHQHQHHRSTVQPARASATTSTSMMTQKPGRSSGKKSVQIADFRSSGGATNVDKHHVIQNHHHYNAPGSRVVCANFANNNNQQPVSPNSQSTTLSSTPILLDTIQLAPNESVVYVINEDQASDLQDELQLLHHNHNHNHHQQQQPIYYVQQGESDHHAQDPKHGRSPYANR